MDAVYERLVREGDGLIALFDPPFDAGSLQPGYIKGYVPGIRENGGQYTHAATWVVWATALLGDGDRAMKLWNLLNPICHGATKDQVARYKVEPYVVSADVYGAPPHTGRGGWTWYTGSAGWMYRVALEAILGFRRQGQILLFQPCVPASWSDYEVTYRHGRATYKIRFDNSSRRWPRGALGNDGRGPSARRKCSPQRRRPDARCARHNRSVITIDRWVSSSRSTDHPHRIQESLDKDRARFQLFRC